MKMKIGDLIVCHCKANMWYKGIVGILVSFEKFGCDELQWTPGAVACILYPNGNIVKLTPSGLEVLS